MVGAVRFELTTSCTRNKRASQATLRPEPDGQSVWRRVRWQRLFRGKFRDRAKEEPARGDGAWRAPCSTMTCSRALNRGRRRED